MKIVGESRLCDDEAIASFLPKLNQLLLEGGYTLEQIDNADETGLFWKGVPDRTLRQRTDTMKGYKVPKERVTFLFCTNSSGSHKITPLCIGKSR